jgi:K+-transporting ATPase c subunit
MATTPSRRRVQSYSPDDSPAGFPNLGPTSQKLVDRVKAIAQFLGEPRVNVLLLNLEIDDRFPVRP